MTWQKHDDECKGCLPAMIDAKTGQRMPDDCEPMMAMMRVWANTALAERQAFHRVTCLNSRVVTDLLVMHSLQRRFAREIE